MSRVQDTCNGNGGFVSHRLLGWIVTVVVLAAVVAGFFVVGSPAEARKERADEQRVFDLEQITVSVRHFYKKEKRLPKNLAEAAKKVRALDFRQWEPVTGQQYEYRVVDSKHFELCATFETDQREDGRRSRYRYWVGPPFEFHGLGRQCFTIDAEQPKDP